jgi:DNA-directed RNA polymerase specialized sigma24 family protein
MADPGTPSLERPAGAPPGDAGPPVSRARAAAAGDAGVSREELWAFLALESTQDRIRQVVHANVPRRTPRDVFDEIVQKANLRAVEAKSRPRSSAQLRPWISTLAEHAAVDHFRRVDVQLKYENREIDVEQVAREPADAPAAAADGDHDVAPWMLSVWLEKRIAKHESDRRTYALIVEKARGEKTYEQLAAERGETVAALKSRVHEFKKKYQPLRRSYEQNRDTVLFALRFGGRALAVLAAAALILAALLYSLRIGPFAPERRHPAPGAPAEFEPPRGGDVAHPPPPRE